MQNEGMGEPRGSIRMQRSFAEYYCFRKQHKVTRREAFSADMDRVVPWQRLEAHKNGGI
jgi:hypothetical protein